MSGLFDVQDLFAIGLGLDISGGYLAARGLLASPEDIARLSGMYWGFNPHEAVARTRDRIDVMVGLGSLLGGFGLQALGYILTIGGFTSSTPSAQKGLVSFALVIGSLALSQLIARQMRHRLLRRSLVQVARYDENSLLHDHPLSDCIVAFARILGYEAEGDEDGLALAQRAFGPRLVQDTMVTDNNGNGRIRYSQAKKAGESSATG